MTPEKVYRPVFAGETIDNDKIIIYLDREDRFHVAINDGDLHAFNPDDKLECWFNHIEGQRYFTAQSKVWTGTAVGSDAELRLAERR